VKNKEYVVKKISKKEAHRLTHKRLHEALDELVADMISETNMLPSKTTVLALIEWSSKQTQEVL